MPLTAKPRASGIYYIRGTHHGVAVERSAKTRDKRAAEALREKLEREIFEAVVLGKPPERTFAEAAIGYMNAGGERAPLAPILLCEVPITGDPNERRLRPMADWPLKEIDQSVIVFIANALYPNGAGSTKNRKVFTPISAVLNYASEQPSWGYQAFRIRRPSVPAGRVDWRRPAEIEWWLERAGHARGILTNYIGTGARASELVNLDWQNVSPGGQRITLWDDETKAGVARYVDLQARARRALPKRPDIGVGPVFTNLEGEGWSSYNAINSWLDTITERETLLIATPTELQELKPLRATAYRRVTVDRAVRNAAWAEYRRVLESVRQRGQVRRIHLHVLRHTWATWAYAVTRDLTFLMGQGGWASEKLALRYIHGGSDDIKAEVLGHGWEMRATPVIRVPAGSRRA